MGGRSVSGLVTVSEARYFGGGGGGYRLSGFISDHKFLTLLSGVATFGSYGKIKNHNDTRVLASPRWAMGEKSQRERTKTLHWQASVVNLSRENTA